MMTLETTTDFLTGSSAVKFLTRHIIALKLPQALGRKRRVPYRIFESMVDIVFKLVILRTPQNLSPTRTQ